jgi:hypothetical protein
MNTSNKDQMIEDLLCELETMIAWTSNIQKLTCPKQLAEFNAARDTAHDTWRRIVHIVDEV